MKRKHIPGIAKLVSIRYKFGANVVESRCQLLLSEYSGQVCLVFAMLQACCRKLFDML